MRKLLPNWGLSELNRLLVVTRELLNPTAMVVPVAKPWL